MQFTHSFLPVFLPVGRQLQQQQPVASVWRAVIDATDDVHYCRSKQTNSSIFIFLLPSANQTKAETPPTNSHLSCYAYCAVQSCLVSVTEDLTTNCFSSLCLSETYLHLT